MPRKVWFVDIFRGLHQPKRSEQWSWGCNATSNLAGPRSRMRAGVTRRLNFSRSCTAKERSSCESIKLFMDQAQARRNCCRRVRWSGAMETDLHYARLREYPTAL